MGGRLRSLFEGRLALGFAETGHGIAQSADHTLLAKNDHRVEERRRHRLADDGDASGVDQQARFDAGRFGDGAGSVVTRIVVPLLERLELVFELRKDFRRFRIFPEFFFGRCVAREFVAEKCVRPRREIRQEANPRSQQIHRFREPRVVSAIRTWCRAGSPLRFPQTAAL